MDMSMLGMAIITSIFALLGSAKRKAGLKMNETEFRNTVRNEALKVKDWSCASMEQRQLISDLLGETSDRWDLDRPFHVIFKPDGKTIDHTEGVSTCGLVARGIGFRAGIPWPEYIRPYIPGQVFTDMRKHAQRFNAERPSGLPNVGDAFIIGVGLSTHMGTVVDVANGIVTSIDGGQVDSTPDKVGVKWLQCIRQVSRKWSAQSVVCIIDQWKIYQGLSQ